MLRGIMPGDPRYEQSDILDHIDGILAKSGNKLLSDWKEDGLDKNGQPWETDTLFSERLPDEFIKTCSLVLGGLMDGLSLHGRRDASENLERGSELSNILHPVPLEAISKILFARPNLTFEDVKEALHPGKIYTSMSSFWMFHLSNSQLIVSFFLHQCIANLMSGRDMLMCWRATKHTKKNSMKNSFFPISKMKLKKTARSFPNLLNVVQLHVAFHTLHPVR